MTTSEPTLAREIFDAAAARGVEALDAPVSGGDVGARNAALVIMVGGTQEAFDRVSPLFETLGKTVVLEGGPGSGQHTKMMNQIAIASGMIGVCEALLYAYSAGLDLERALDTISGGAAGSWSLSNYAPRILRGRPRAGIQDRPLPERPRDRARRGLGDGPRPAWDDARRGALPGRA